MRAEQIVPSLARDSLIAEVLRRWKKSDTEAYNGNGLEKIPAEKIISALQAVTRRTPATINGFNYFVREIVTLRDPRSRAWQKKQLEMCGLFISESG
jgi:hypothetical protein